MTLLSRDWTKDAIRAAVRNFHSLYSPQTLSKAESRLAGEGIRFVPLQKIAHPYAESGT